jgi:molybdopterin converting factor subunit 1
MRITVLFFALIRERAGASQIELNLQPDASVADAAELIGRRFPALVSLLPRTGYAVNQSYVDRTRLLSDGDELALIPPVSGGSGGGIGRGSRGGSR